MHCFYIDALQQLHYSLTANSLWRWQATCVATAAPLTEAWLPNGPSDPHRNIHAHSYEAMGVKCFAQGHMSCGLSDPGFEPPTLQSLEDPFYQLSHSRLQ